MELQATIKVKTLEEHYNQPSEISEKNLVISEVPERDTIVLQIDYDNIHLDRHTANELLEAISLLINRMTKDEG